MSEVYAVRGQITLPNADLPPQAAVLVVQVEDVSRADAPSTVVGEQRYTNVPLRSGASIPFALEIPKELIDQQRSYSVRVHFDISGSGQVKAGDLISTQSCPVLTRGYPDVVAIPVKRV
jgi:uncharacterized lipoprotein YbaY